MPTVTPAPTIDVNEYSQLFHHTCYDNALEILRSEVIKGGDTHQHANFFASSKYKNKDPKLPRCRQVCLEFKWNGNQAVLDSWPNDGEPRNTAIAQPILFHIITQDPKDWSNWSIASRNYWQSILYPGSNGLMLCGCTFLAVPDAPKKPGFLSKCIGKKVVISKEFSKYEKVNKLVTEKMGKAFRVES